MRGLAALLRIADALDRRHSQRVLDVRCRLTGRRARFAVLSGIDPAVEMHAGEAKSNLFRKVFERDVSFTAVRVRKAEREPVTPPKLRLLRRLSA